MGTLYKKFSYIHCIIIYAIQLWLEFDMITTPLTLKFIENESTSKCIGWLYILIFLHILCSLELMSLNRRGVNILSKMTTELENKFLNNFSVAVLLSFKVYQVIQYVIKILIFILLVLYCITGFKSYFLLSIGALLFLHLAVSIKKIFIKD